MELARNAGSRGILVRTGYGEGDLAWHAADWPTQPSFVALTLTEAADWILEQAAPGQSTTEQP
jgi:D-glycero-D-manno-heptose 1,7-bisphosphate phosphatase